VTQTSADPFLSKALALVFAGVVMPVLLVMIWRMALGVDPLNLTILTKGNGEITAETPGQLRIIGGVVTVLGLLVAGAALNAIKAARATFRQAALMALAGLEVAGFGGGVYWAAHVAEDAVGQEQLP
jgi:hypothetical protein